MPRTRKTKDRRPPGAGETYVGSMRSGSLRSYIAIACLLLFLADSSLLLHSLVHGFEEVNGTHSDLPFGRPTSQVRDAYKAKLDEMEHGKIADFLNKDDASKDLPAYAKRPNPICDFASDCSTFRSEQRVKMRARHSALIHLFLNIRDAVVYQTLTPPTFEFLFERKMHKLKKEAATDEPVSAANVCRELIKSSTHSNEHYNAYNEHKKAFAEDLLPAWLVRGFVGFVLENFFYYLGLCLVLVALECMWSLVMPPKGRKNHHT